MTSVSQATRPIGSSASTASRTESEIWSATLSGCPSVTDSEVTEKERLAMPNPSDPLARGCGEAALLVGRRAPHQPRGELGERGAVEHGADALGDRQLDRRAGGRARAAPARSSAPRRPGRSRPPPRSGVSAAGDQLAGAAVAAARVPAGDDQVAHPGEAGERLRVGARRLAEPRHLGEPARDQRRLGVVARADAVARAGGERDHVLRGGAELDADQVVVEVDAEDRRVERRPGARGRARASSLAITAAPGSPAATSSAMFGPDMTATGRPRTSVESRSPLSGSRPLVRLSSGAEPGSASTTVARTRGSGAATTTRSASSTGASASVVAATSARSTSGR